MSCNELFKKKHHQRTLSGSCRLCWPKVKGSCCSMHTLCFLLLPDWDDVPEGVCRALWGLVPAELCTGLVGPLPPTTRPGAVPPGLLQLRQLPQEMRLGNMWTTNCSIKINKYSFVWYSKNWDSIPRVLIIFEWIEYYLVICQLYLSMNKGKLDRVMVGIRQF